MREKRAGMSKWDRFIRSLLARKAPSLDFHGKEFG
jgi:hypothetical protein